MKNGNDDTTTSFVDRLRTHFDARHRETVDPEPEWLPDATGYHVEEHACMSEITEEDQNALMRLKETTAMHNLNVDETCRIQKSALVGTALETAIRPKKQFGTA